MTICAIFPGHILARISILPKISRIWLCVQTDRCVTSVPYVFETLSRYFESKQHRNPGQDVSRTNGTYGHPIYIDIYIYLLISSQSDPCTLRYESPCVHTVWWPFWKLSENFHQKRSPLNVHFRSLSLYFVSFTTYCNIKRLMFRLLNIITWNLDV